LIYFSKIAEKNLAEILEKFDVHWNTWTICINLHLSLKFFIIFKPLSFGQVDTFDLSIALTVYNEPIFDKLEVWKVLLKLFNHF